jgi:cytochrome c-type biogenesis protein CcmF
MYLKPFINWIWWGCSLMAIGGIITLFDKRYQRLRVRPVVAEPAR